MNLLAKLRLGSERAAPPTARSPESDSPNPSTRVSNGLKDFLWHLGDLKRGRLLDLGSVSQSTVTFFTERGFRVYTEDVLRAWKEFLGEEEKRLRSAPLGSDAGEIGPAALAERFMGACLRYPEENFHAILAWDLFDYLDPQLLPRMAQRLYELTCPGGVVLAAFHTAKPASFHRYRVLGPQTIELLPATPPWSPLRVFQNREILNLFGRFRSSKTFVGRDQLREALFTR